MPRPRVDTRPLFNCRVCNATPASLHYGSIVCSSCKMFFLRVVRRGVLLKCGTPRNCQEVIACSNCRFEKCLRVGMNRDEVGSQARLRQMFNAQPYRALDSYISAYETPYRKMVAANSTQDTEELTTYLVNLERFCDAEPSTSNYNFDYNMDITFIGAFMKPTELCERVPIGFGDHHPSTLEVPSSASIHRLFFRSMLHYIDWCRGSGELTEMSVADMITLCRHQFNVCDFLMRAYNSYKNGSSCLLYAFGCVFGKFPEVPNSSRARAFVSRIEKHVAHDILSVMEELEMTQEEYVFLKKIVFFSADHTLTDEARIFMNVQRRKYDHALLQHLLRNFSREEAVFRLLKLLSIVQPLLRMNIQTDSHRALFEVYNKHGMESQLRTDLLMRQINN